MTLAFVDSAYPSGWSETGYPAVAANKVLLDAARDSGIPIFFTKSGLPPAAQRTDAQKGRWKRPQGYSTAFTGLPDGDVIVDDLTPREGELVIDKGGKPSAFFGTVLESYLTYYRIDTTIITGMVTSGCVRATVLDAFQNNYFVVVPQECVADRSQISHKVTLFDLHSKYADVASLEETLRYLKKVKGQR
jgi:nicotinamidase-related amidase